MFSLALNLPGAGQALCAFQKMNPRGRAWRWPAAGMVLERLTINCCSLPLWLLPSV